MSNTPIKNFRIPLDLAQRLSETAAAKGTTETAVILEALKAYLIHDGFMAEVSKIRDRLDAIEWRLGWKFQNLLDGQKAVIPDRAKTPDEQWQQYKRMTEHQWRKDATRAEIQAGRREQD